MTRAFFLVGLILTVACRGTPPSRAQAEGSQAAPRPKDKELLAVPVNKLYDRGTTVMMSADLLRDRIGGPTIALHPEAAKNLGLEADQLVNVSFNGVSGDARLKFDDTISVGVALVPRSMGLAIREPVPAKVRPEGTKVK